MSFHRLNGDGGGGEQRKTDGGRVGKRWRRGDSEQRGGETVPEAVENEASICFFSSTSSLFRAAMYLE